MKLPVVVVALLLFLCLACNLPLALTHPSPPPPTRAPASGLRPADETGFLPTAAPTTAASGLQPAPEPTATLPPPTPLPDVEIEPPEPPLPSELGRPRLSGEPTALDTAHFRIHFTLTGDDAAPRDDQDGNAVPDYVEEVARTLEHSWRVQIEQYGWAPPPPDAGTGGDDRYDIYLQNILFDGTAGYADGGHPQMMVGDNPLTEALETRSSYSYVTLDNDYVELDKWGAGDITSLALMRSTVAHEFHHALQYGYDADEPAGWLWEAGGTWIQDEVFDDINDGVDELPSVFKSPDICQLSEGYERVESEGRWYGMWVFLRYASERHGPAVVRDIWEQARALDGYAAVEAALVEHGTNLDAVRRGFNLALLARDFEEGDTYPVLRLEGSATPGAAFVPADGVAQMGADYVEVQSNDSITVRLDADELEGTLAAVRAGEMHVFPFAGDTAAVDASQFDHVYLIVANPNRAQSEAECSFAPYTLAVEMGGQPDSPASILPAPNFVAPAFETLQDVEGYYIAGEPVAAPPGLLPTYLPPDYHFSESYLLDKGEFGAPDEAIWYVPGDGPATVLDFYGPGSDFLSITASESPYARLAGWLADVNYAPALGEEQRIAGVSVLLNDLSDASGPYSSATFVHNAQFIVVEGTIAPAEMARVVKGLLRGTR